MLSRAAKRSSGAATKGDQQQPQEAQRIQLQQPHIHRPTAPAATAKPQNPKTPKPLQFEKFCKKLFYKKMKL